MAPLPTPTLASTALSDRSFDLSALQATDALSKKKCTDDAGAAAAEFKAKSGGPRTNGPATTAAQPTADAVDFARSLQDAAARQSLGAAILKNRW